MFCLNMLAIALELARGRTRPTRTWPRKFFEHFVYIAHAMSDMGGEGIELWDEEDGFFYDVLHLPGGDIQPLKVRSLVGLIPLFAVEVLEPDNRGQAAAASSAACSGSCGTGPTSGTTSSRQETAGWPDALPALPRERASDCAASCGYMLDEAEFLSPHGIRALSRYHRDHPYVFRVDGREHRVDYEPAESTTGLFGGNSNWRGPDLVPDELPADRGAPAVRPLLRRRASRWSSRRARARR